MVWGFVMCEGTFVFTFFFFFCGRRTNIHLIKTVTLEWDKSYLTCLSYEWLELNKNSLSR